MQSIIPPQLPTDLPKLDDLQKALSRDESLTNFVASNQDLAFASANALSIAEARLEKIIATEANFEKLGLSDVVFLRCDLTATNCADSSWRRVQLNNTRFSGVKLQTSTLKDIVFDGCKLDLANFRFSKLKNVVFKNCVLEEADFYSAELDNVQFQTCLLLKAEFSAAKCKSVDLRTSELAGVLGIDGIKGATIDDVQLVTLAPLLASQLGLKIEDI